MMPACTGLPPGLLMRSTTPRALLSSKVHNLEASPLGNDQPGVQMIRFSPVPEPVTQVVALRAGAPVTGPRGLPQLSYLRVGADTTTEVKCRFGA